LSIRRSREGDRSVQSVGVGQGQGLGRDEAVEADLVERLGDRREVEVAEPGRPPVRVNEMDVADEPASRPDRIGQVDFLDVHVEQVGQKDDVGRRQ
jgi:hypothetical protein